MTDNTLGPIVVTLEAAIILWGGFAWGWYAHKRKRDKQMAGYVAERLMGQGSINVPLSPTGQALNPPVGYDPSSNPDVRHSLPSRFSHLKSHVGQR